MIPPEIPFDAWLVYVKQALKKQGKASAAWSIENWRKCWAHGMLPMEAVSEYLMDEIPDQH